MTSCRRAKPAKPKAASSLANLQQPPAKPVIDPSAPAEVQGLQKRLLEMYPQTLLEWEGTRDDRARMIRPAPTGFVPVSNGRRLKLTLELASARIKPGGTIWYRLDLQNIGGEPVNITDPIFKHPSLLMTRVKFHARGPGMEEQTLRSPPLLGHDPATLFERELKTPQEVAAVFQEQKASFRRDPVRVLLLPGETVVTAPVAPVKGAPPALMGGYHPLESWIDFKTPGRYQIHCVYAEHKPSPPSEEFIRKMASHGTTRAEELAVYERHLREWIPPVESNLVTFEVLR